MVRRLHKPVSVSPPNFSKRHNPPAASALGQHTRRVESSDSMPRAAGPRTPRAEQQRVLVIGQQQSLTRRCLHVLAEAGLLAAAVGQPEQHADTLGQPDLLLLRIPSQPAAALHVAGRARRYFPERPILVLADAEAAAGDAVLLKAMGRLDGVKALACPSCNKQVLREVRMMLGLP